MFQLPANPAAAVAVVLLWWPIAVALTFAKWCAMPFWLILRAM